MARLLNPLVLILLYMCACACVYYIVCARVCECVRACENARAKIQEVTVCLGFCSKYSSAADQF